MTLSLVVRPWAAEKLIVSAGGLTCVTPSNVPSDRVTGAEPWLALIEIDPPATRCVLLPTVTVTVGLVFASVLNDGTSTSPPVLPDETASASLLASADTVMLFATWIVRLLLPMSAVTVGVVSASAVALVTLTAAPPRLRTLA